VSSTSLSGGEVKQVQFVEDGTIAVLHTDDGMFPFSLIYTTKLTILANKSHLLNFPISPSPAETNTEEEANSNQFHPRYESYKTPSNSTQFLPNPLKVDLGGDEAGLVLHSYSLSGSKSRPIRLSVNGRRKDRRTVCTLYADQIQYEVLDIDNQAHDEDETMEE
jgi:anaphase-promoting complex subunit 4